MIAVMLVNQNIYSIVISLFYHHENGTLSDKSEYTVYPHRRVYSIDHDDFSITANGSLMLFLWLEYRVRRLAWS